MNPTTYKAVWHTWSTTVNRLPSTKIDVDRRPSTQLKIKNNLENDSYPRVCAIGWLHRTAHLRMWPRIGVNYPPRLNAQDLTTWYTNNINFAATPCPTLPLPPVINNACMNENKTHSSLPGNIWT